MHDALSFSQEVISGIAQFLGISLLFVLGGMYIFGLVFVAGKSFMITVDLLSDGHSKDWEHFKYFAKSVKYRIRNWGRHHEPDYVVIDYGIGPLPDNVVPLSVEEVLKAQRRKEQRHLDF